MNKFLPMAMMLPLLFGCVTTKPRTPDSSFDDLTHQIVSNRDKPSYQRAWNAYLKSSYIKNTSIHFEEYARALARVKSGEIKCTDVNWAALTKQNFWSLKPHISAASCYEGEGRAAEAAPYNAAVEFILKGILDSGDGLDSNSAYEVATLGDADDFVELLGFKVLDSYGELHSARQALYYVVVAEEISTGRQQEIYFNNQRFFHALLDRRYPFLGIDDGWKTIALPAVSKNSKVMKVPLAAAEFADGNLENSYQLYMSAIAEGSIHARLQLAKHCLKKKFPQVGPDQCISLLVEAAELEYAPAIVFLAFVYDAGLGVKADPALAQELLSSIGKRRAPGYPSFVMYQLWNNGIYVEKNEKQARRYLAEAVKLDYEDAKLAHAYLEFEGKKQTIEQYMAQMRVLADAGSEMAAYFLGVYLQGSSEKNSKEHAESKQWLLKAAKYGQPQAYYQLGIASAEGEYGAKNLVDAAYYFNEAAIRFDAPAMQYIGYYNSVGRGVLRNPELAFSWYYLCHALGRASCTTNLGNLFEEGLGVKKDYKIAIELYTLAMQKDYARAFNNLALVYQYGLGVEKNINRAMELFEQAAQKGYYYGDYNLGVLYLEGIEVPRDLQKAKAYFEKAKDHSSSAIRLAEIAKLLKG